MILNCQIRHIEVLNDRITSNSNSNLLSYFTENVAQDRSSDAELSPLNMFEGAVIRLKVSNDYSFITPAS